MKYGYIKANARMGYWCGYWNDTCMYRVVFMEMIKMIEQWQELKETIIELRDNDGTGTQQEVCKFLVNYMGVLEKQMVEQEPVLDKIREEIKGKYRVVLKDTPKDDWAVRWNDCIDEVLQIIDKHKAERSK